MRLALRQPWTMGTTSIYCSTEAKAVDGATILGHHLSLNFSKVHAPVRMIVHQPGSFLQRNLSRSPMSSLPGQKLALEVGREQSTPSIAFRQQLSE